MLLSTERLASTRLVAAFTVLIVFAISACSSISQSDAGNPGFAVDTKILSTSAGIKWGYSPKSGFVVTIREYDGTNRDVSWTPEALSDSESLRKLRYCFDQAGDKLRFTDQEVREASGFYGLLVNKCAEYASLTTFNDVRLADQREFDVWIKAGNAYKHMPYAGPIITASSSPFLGAIRKIRQLGEDSDAAKTASDVKECVNTAADKGVFETMAITGGEMSYTSSSIQPFLNRFDKCMRDRKYEVESPHNPAAVSDS